MPVPDAHFAAPIPTDERRWLQRALAGHFELVRLLGRGATGTVYLALDRTLQRWVANKALLPELSGSVERREQFKREALANASSPTRVSCRSTASARRTRWPTP